VVRQAGGEVHGVAPLEPERKHTADYPYTLGNWSGAALAGDKAAAGIHGRPSVSMTSALKKPRSCLAAVER
jgi:hypothetical protein